MKNLKNSPKKEDIVKMANLGHLGEIQSGESKLYNNDSIKSVGDKSSSKKPVTKTLSHIYEQLKGFDEEGSSALKQSSLDPRFLGEQRLDIDTIMASIPPV